MKFKHLFTRSAFATSALAACISSALASDECGPYALTVNCTPGVYASGIDYTVAGPFTLNLDNGVIANNPGADPYTGPSYGAGLTVGGPADITINMLPGNASTISGGFYGILAYTDDGSSGNIAVNANGNISGGSTGIYTVTGSGASGSMAINVGNNAVVTGAETAIFAYSQASSPAAPITITTAAGSNLLGGTAMVVQDDGGGVVNITANGDIGRGVAVQNGIVAIVYNTGSATLNVNGNVNSLNGGIFAGAGGSNGDIIITTGSNANITSGGGAYFGSGIEAVQANDIFDNPSTGNISITHNGQFNANNAIGIYASTTNASGAGTIAVIANGSVNSSNEALFIDNAGMGASTVDVGFNGLLGSFNTGADALFASVQTGSFSFSNAGNVYSHGANASALHVSSAGGAITFNNLSTGFLNAANDSIIVTSGASSTLNNSGTISGYLSLGSSNNQVSNDTGGMFNLRNFSDSDTNGIRDTQSVSFSSVNGSFNNTGTLNLSTVSGASSISQAGRYTPIGINAPPLGAGIEQAHLLGVSVFNHAGIINTQDRHTGGSSAVAGDVLVITSGSVAGTPGAIAGVFQSNGGILYLDSVLNAGGINSVSDMLVVDSTTLSAGGATSVFIDNAGGLGAQTVGDGIKIIDVLTGPAGSVFGAFSLGNTRIASGAYEYRLYRSGLQMDDGDWYLRSSFRPAVASYSSVVPALAEYGNAMLGTLHERVGESKTLNGLTSAAWIRWINQGTDTTSSTFEDARFDSRFSAVQAGLDIWQHQQENDSRWQAGFSFGYGHVNNRTQEAGVQSGTLRSNVITYGIYGTWHGANDSYIDVVVQKNRYDDISALATDGDLLQTTGDGSVVSIEAGYPFAIGQYLKLEPQAQLVWQTLSIENANDNFSRVAFDDNKNMLGRLGARLVRSWDGNDRQTIAWLRGNIWHHFNDNSDVTISSALDGSSPTVIDGQVAGTWAELGIGSTINFGDNTSLFAEISYYFDLEGPNVKGYNSNIGLKWQW